MGGGLGSPPPLASPCKAAFRLMWRCFVVRTNICREKTEFQLGVDVEGEEVEGEVACFHKADHVGDCYG